MSSMRKLAVLAIALATGLSSCEKKGDQAQQEAAPVKQTQQEVSKVARTFVEKLIENPKEAFSLTDKEGFWWTDADQFASIAKKNLPDWASADRVEFVKAEDQSPKTGQAKRPTSKHWYRLVPQDGKQDLIVIVELVGEGDNARVLSFSYSRTGKKAS